MHILLACDKFKGSLSSALVTKALAAPLTQAGHTVTAIPLADGGDGTVDIALQCGFSAHTATVSGPLGDPVQATWASRRIGQRTYGLIELAQASGIALLQPTSESARLSTTRGTGELINAALDFGCTDIIVAVGGSATTDAGLGMLSSLGVTHSDWHPGQAVSVDVSGLDPRIAQTRFVLASDVDNPLTGPNGAAAVYGPQKGATAQDIADLDATLDSVARAIDPAGYYRNMPGAGAAGGAGFAALAVLGATRQAGADFMMELTGFHQALSSAEVVITGEGRFDSQSLQGKGPGAVIAAANAAQVPVYVVAGSSEFPTGQPLCLNPSDGAEHRAVSIAQIFALTDYADIQTCMQMPGPLLDRASGEIAHLLV